MHDATTLDGPGRLAQ